MSTIIDRSSDTVVRLLVAAADAAETAGAAAEAKRVKKPKAPKLNATQRKLLEMLRENTGASILDSGSAYGRNWQRNQARALWDEPASTIRARLYNGHAEFEVTHNLFHWLSEACEYDATMTRKLRALGRKEGIYGLELADRFPEWLAERGHEVGGIYGEGEPISDNSYNHECLLSQTIQYVYFRCDDQDYVALQIHGGCDVRGGYTDPVVFRASVEGDPVGIFDYARAGIAPDHHERQAIEAEAAKQGRLFPDDGPEWHEINWSTDDGCHWYYQGACGLSYESKQLEKMPAVEVETREQWEPGKVCILPDGTALCPFTGAKLVAYFY